MELLNLDNVRAVLMRLATDIRENYKEQLTASDRYTTEHSLIDSVVTEVKTIVNGYEVTMTLNDYWKYVEKGTPPHFPPPSAILRWIEIKPVIPRPDSKGRVPSPKSLAYLICRSIAEYGTQGSHDLEKTEDAIIPFYKEEIEAALAKDCGDYIRSVIHAQFT